MSQQQNKYALLYLNPLDENISKREGCLIEIGKDKKGMFKFLLEQYAKCKLDSDKYFSNNSFNNWKKKLSFKDEIKIGDRLYFEDMAIYSIVKNNTFNGMPLPDIDILHKNGDVEVLKHFVFNQ